MTVIHFIKMHGIGNDYVYVDCFNEQVDNPNKLAKWISDRHFGVGSDGLILIKPSNIADCKMEIYNADGSEGEMCGNGIRCVAKYVYDYGIIKSTCLTVETKSGIKNLTCHLKNEKVDRVSVNMGKPNTYNLVINKFKECDNINLRIKNISKCACICMDIPIETFINSPKNNFMNKSPDYKDLKYMFLKFLEITSDSFCVSNKSIKENQEEKSIKNQSNESYNLKSIHLSLISIGNPHAVIFLKNENDLDSIDLEKIGPLFENYEAFPNRINTEFVVVKDRNHIKMRVWERGSGETLACGTGACASVVAAMIHDLVDKDSAITVSLLGGELEIFLLKETDEIIMTGETRSVFTGEIDEEEFLD